MIVEINMPKITKRILVRLIICVVLICGFTVFVRDWKGVRLLVLTPKILKYRPVIQEHAVLHQLDWRLMTALIVQESGFNKNTKSHAGAMGLMQLMPETSKELGVSDPYNPTESIAGATLYFRSLYDLYPDSSHENRVRLALASYNGGRGHIKDAQQVTMHRNDDPFQWDCLRKNLSLLTEKDKVLHSQVWESGTPPHGYFRGYNETLNYVKQVLGYYERLCYFSGIIDRAKSFVPYKRVDENV